ncbi:MAG: DNA polymerase domain-containing protein, partial [Candidatus Bathyarchaeia archaeon]
FYDSSKNELVEFRDNTHKPYLLIPYPLSKRDEETVRSLQGEIEVVKKRDLFTDEVKEFAKVSFLSPFLVRKAAKRFEKSWENEIEFAHGYAYDHGLIFGALHVRKDKGFTPVLSFPEKLRDMFEGVFGSMKSSDPLKYSQLRHWFTLLHQPVPQIEVELLGIGDEIDLERYYVAVMLSRIVNLPVPEAYTSRSVSDWLKSMMYTYLRKNGVLIPTSKELRKGYEPHVVSGALTVTPKSGIYFNTVVTDFESLYPSCMDSYNLSYETVDCNHEACKSNRVSEVGHHICRKRRGFLSLLIGALKDLRIRWFKPLSKSNEVSDEEKRRAEALGRLLKLITVSSYGVTVRIHGLACPPLAESITGYGRYALKTTWKIAEEDGLHPVYGDTDSIFLENASSEKVEWLIKTVKEKLKLDLAVEKRYSVCVLPKAKKAYFGIFEDGTVDLKGLTAIKSNSPNFIQNVFQNCVKELSHVKSAQEYELAKARIVKVVQRAIRDLRNGKVELKDLVYSVRLYHDPVEKLRSKVLPQPYQCVAQLVASGKVVKRRDIVSFIKVKPFDFKGRRFTVKPAERVRSVSEINVEDYVHNLTTALNQTFEPMNIRFEIEREKKISDWFK